MRFGRFGGVRRAARVLVCGPRWRHPLGLAAPGTAGRISRPRHRLCLRHRSSRAWGQTDTCRGSGLARAVPGVVEGPAELRVLASCGETPGRTGLPAASSGGEISGGGGAGRGLPGGGLRALSLLLVLLALHLSVLCFCNYMNNTCLYYKDERKKVSLHGNESCQERTCHPQAPESQSPEVATAYTS